jgi:hypothetical protein
MLRREGRRRKRAGRSLKPRPAVFISSPMSLRDKYCVCGIAPLSGMADSRPLLSRCRDRSLAAVRRRLISVAPLLRRPRRFGPTAFVISLLQEKSRGFPNSICWNLVFKEALMKEKGFPALFHVCYHLFASPAPGASPVLVCLVIQEGPVLRRSSKHDEMA